VGISLREEVRKSLVTIDSFLTVTLAIVVLFAGVHLNRKFSLLRKYNIPEPVTGGLLAALFVYGGEL
jgi:ESS family glutamate:Na+ symporter